MNQQIDAKSNALTILSTTLPQTDANCNVKMAATSTLQPIAALLSLFRPFPFYLFIKIITKIPFMCQHNMLWALFLDFYRLPKAIQSPLIFPLKPLQLLHTLIARLL